MDFDLQNVPKIATLLIVIGFFIGAGLIAISSFQSSQTKTYTVTNETINFAVNATNYSFTYKGMTTNTLVTVTNGTHTTDAGSKTLIAIGNWTNNRLVVTLMAATGEVRAGNWNVTYTYDNYNSPGLTMANMSSGIGNLSNQLPTIGTLIGVIILVVIVILSLKSVSKET